MTRISPWVVLPPMIFLSIAAMFFFGLYRADPNDLPSAMIGKPAPDLIVTAIPGLPPATQAMIRSGDLKLVNFWASWCGPCRIEHPNLKELADAGMPIIGLNYKDSPANAKKFLAELGNPYVGVSAVDGRAALEWGVYGVPETFLIDAQGTILLRTAGPVTQRIIREKLIPAIQAAK
jgi:cytochrome c biogenesis protein CcmG/thiol:disulfide interchange protein DsbE